MGRLAFKTVFERYHDTIQGRFLISYRYHLFLGCIYNSKINHLFRWVIYRRYPTIFDNLTYHTVQWLNGISYIYCFSNILRGIKESIQAMIMGMQWSDDFGQLPSHLTLESSSDLSTSFSVIARKNLLNQLLALDYPSIPKYIVYESRTIFTIQICICTAG